MIISSIDSFYRSVGGSAEHVSRKSQPLPFRYRLENADDKYYDRGEFPPPPELWELVRDRAP